MTATPEDDRVALEVAAETALVEEEGGAPALPQPLSLRANVAWTFAGNVVYAACQWAMLIVLAKLTAPEQVGQFALGLAVTAPVIMLTNLQLRAVQATDVRHQHPFGDYLALRLAMTALALLVIAGLAACSGYHRETALVVLVIGLAKAFESISDVVYGLLQQHERLDRIAQSMMIKGPLSLVALAAGVYFTRGVLWGAVGLAASWCLVLVTYDLRSGSMILGQGGREPWPRRLARLAPRWHMPSLLTLMWLSLPLGVVLALGSLNSNVPRYFIQHYSGEHALGLFSAMAYLLVAGTTVVGALGQSVSPRLAKHYAAGDVGAFRRLLWRLVAIALLLAGVGLLVSGLAGKPLLTLLYRPEYGEQAHVLFWIMAAAGVTYLASFLGYAMTAARVFRVQMPLFVAVAGSNALACLVLMPRFGVVGAAWAMLAAAAVQAGGSALILRHALAHAPRNEAAADAV